MARLINKLNVLVKSNFNSVLDSITTRDSSRGTARSGKDMTRQIVMLREQIEAALDQEERTATELDALQRQIEDWDRQADRALQQNDEATARHCVRQIQLTQQQRALLEADLQQHRYATSELIREVNTLEARAAQAAQQTADKAVHTAPDAAASAHDASGPDSESLAERLRRIRQGTKEAASDQPARSAPAEVSEETIASDIAARRQRLSL